MSKAQQFALMPDRRGLIWDLLLYVPTVVALFSIALKLWYGPDQVWSYLLAFMGSFFLFVGANRILGGRLMLLPQSPVRLDVEKKGVRLALRNGDEVELIKDLCYFPDFAGKSFGLTGLDGAGRRRQFVLYRGQFPSDSAFQGVRSLLAVYK